MGVVAVTILLIGASNPSGFMISPMARVGVTSVHVASRVDLTKGQVRSIHIKSAFQMNSERIILIFEILKAS